MAHRGSSDELPENTLTAFSRALEQEADALETDIRFTRDDEIVLMHDATVDRTTNGTGVVAALTLAEIKRLRARRPLAPTFGDEAPPSLVELLEFTRATGTPLALELKDDRFLETPRAEQFITTLDRYGALVRVVLVSFSMPRLEACKRVAPEIPIGMITLNNPFPTYRTELLGPFFPLLFLNPLYAWWAQRAGRVVCPLDIAPEPRLRYYRRLGLPAVMTNHPAETRAALKRL